METRTSPSSMLRASLADPDRDGTNSEAFIIIDFGQRIVLIGGTSYAGEIKKSAFTVMNYLLPKHGVLPMHCSANSGPDGDVALFFGLSGTGKTTLSATSDRTLIGDDEHGWSDGSVFNFEGGCYAKVIRLSEEAEPEIYATTRMFGTILENVTIDLNTRALDLDDDSVTENTRGSYPLSSIPNADPTGVGAPPNNIFFLTAGRLRHHPSRLPPHPRADPVSLPLRLHRQGRGNGEGDSRAGSDLQPVLRGAFHAHATPGVCGHAGSQAGGIGGQRVAGEHRLDGRALRGGASDEDRVYAGDGEGGAGRVAWPHFDGDRPGVRVAGPGGLSGSPRPGSEAPGLVGRR